MTQNYDFLIQSFKSPEFREEIVKHIKMATDSEMTYHSALLKFDSKNKKIIELPLEGAIFACKIIPMELSYEAFYKIIESDEPWQIIGEECKFID